MSDTPRTDEEVRVCVKLSGDPEFVTADFARQLERELAEAKGPRCEECQSPLVKGSLDRSGQDYWCQLCASREANKALKARLSAVTEVGALDRTTGMKSPTLAEQIAWVRNMRDEHVSGLKERGEEPGEGTAMIEAQLRTIEAPRCEWIPVSERRPPMMYPVIAYDGLRVKACYRTGDNTWSAFSSLDVVTHWTAYPNPPSMNGDDAK